MWEAEELGSGLTVALKMPIGPMPDEDRARFRREIRLQSQLDHENILPVLDYDVDSELLWFVAPKADGNLHDMLPTVSDKQAIELFRDVVAGVSYGHRNRIIHRDIKPGNVLVFSSADTNRRLTAKVADFGLGRPLTRDTSFETARYVGIGSDGFAAPEQWYDLRSVDHRADIYSLGRLLQYILTMVAPPDSPMVRRLDYCIRTSTAASPPDRYQSVDEFAADLSLVLERPRSLERPVDTALALIQSLLESGDFGAAATRPLAQLFLEHRDDYRLMVGMVPRVPARLWSALIKHHAPVIVTVIEGYVSALDGPLPVDSALSAMRLLEELLGTSDNDQIHEVGLKAILRLAWRYDLGEFAYIAARCVNQETNALVVQAMARFLTENKDLAAWCAAHLGRSSLPPVMLDAIRDA